MNLFTFFPPDLVGFPLISQAHWVSQILGALYKHLHVSWKNKRVPDSLEANPSFTRGCDSVRLTVNISGLGETNSWCRVTGLRQVVKVTALRLSGQGWPRPPAQRQLGTPFSESPLQLAERRGLDATERLAIGWSSRPAFLSDTDWADVRPAPRQPISVGVKCGSCLQPGSFRGRRARALGRAGLAGPGLVEGHGAWRRIWRGYPGRSVHERSRAKRKKRAEPDSFIQSVLSLLLSTPSIKLFPSILKNLKSKPKESWLYK